MKYYIPALVWAGAILLGSAWPGDDLSRTFGELMIWDKALHALAYFVLAILTAWAWTRQGPSAQRPMVFALLIVIAYGILIEFLQFALFPSRRFEIFDILANCTGALIGHIVIYLFTK